MPEQGRDVRVRASRVQGLNDPYTFLLAVIARQPEGWFFLAAKSARTGRWKEVAIRNRCRRVKIVEFLDDHPPERFDLYFSVSAFGQPRRLAECALPSRMAHVDIDDADPSGYDPAANILWETSPGRSQGLWLSHALQPARIAEAMSRHLVRTYGGDPNGWSCTKVLRIPGTFNHKPGYDRPPVRLLRADFETARLWPEVTAQALGPPDDFSFDPAKHDWRKVVQKFKPKIRPRYWALMLDRTVKSPDRSRCIWMIVAALRAAGASPDEIASVVWVSPYFQSRVAQQADASKSLDREINRILNKLETKQ